MIKKINILLILILNLYSFSSYGNELDDCSWKKTSEVPCLTISSTPNSTKLNQNYIGKIIITKKQMEESGYHDVRSLLEQVSGVDIYSDGPIGQKTSVFMRGTNSNHTLVLLNGVAINDQSSPKAMYDFGYDFLQGLQQIEIYKGASGAIFGPGAIGGAINFVTDINYQNSISFFGSSSRTNGVEGNYNHITKKGWHHNLQFGSSQIKEISAQNTSKDLDGTKNLTLGYNSMKFLDDNLKLKVTGCARKTHSGYDSWDDENANADNLMYALQSSLERKDKDLEDNFTTHIHVHDRYYDTAVKNEYYSESYTFTGERKLSVSDNLSYGFGGEYNYNKGEFDIKGIWGSSAKGHSDNIGIFSNFGYKLNTVSTLSSHLRIDKHKYSAENFTYRINFTRLIDKLTFSLSESTGLRYPDLFVLHGENPSGTFKSMNTTKPETSLTRELTTRFSFSDNIFFETTAYKGSVSNVLNRDTSTFGYNETIDINQEGLENTFVINGQKQKIALSGIFSKSREGSGRPQLRRPEKQYSIKFSKEFIPSLLGPFEINYDYRYLGKAEDWINGTVRAKAESINIMNLKLSKKIFNIDLGVNILNLTNEKYQKPDTYNQEGRRFELSFSTKY